ncbi:DUF5403 family protein [Streptomyces sp. NRRL WC-3742]|uniref:DUF5403 family protein n=1 Tax=Streptomyces sp. NRRL WC-3742 TaxID=1463934 RepID=UPI0004C4F4DA|nr:DUF5403 family protein [Streptomyces sp. NRRL WC-3742]
MAETRPDLDAVIAALPGVMGALKLEAEERKARVTAKAALHIDTGQFIAGLKIKRHAKGYAIVNEDPLAAHKNWGGFNHRAHREVDGIHAMEAALW